MLIVIESNGMLKHIYSDDFKIPHLGGGKIERASNVEPVHSGSESGWLVKIKEGPYLGPYARRDEALQREIDWLEAHDLGLAR